MVRTYTPLMTCNLLFLIQFTFHRPIKFSPFTSCSVPWLFDACGAMLAARARASVTSKVNSISYLSSSNRNKACECVHIHALPRERSSHLTNSMSYTDDFWIGGKKLHCWEIVYEWNARTKQQHITFLIYHFKWKNSGSYPVLKAHDFLICTQLYLSLQRQGENVF